MTHINQPEKSICTTCICILNLLIYLHTSIHLNFEMNSTHYKKVIIVSLSERIFKYLITVGKSKFNNQSKNYRENSLFLYKFKEQLILVQSMLHAVDAIDAVCPQINNEVVHLAPTFNMLF